MCEEIRYGQEDLPHELFKRLSNTAAVAVDALITGRKGNGSASVTNATTTDHSTAEKKAMRIFKMNQWRRLRFDSAGWTADHMRDFAEALPMFTQLKTLSLWNNKLQDEGAAILAWYLEAPLVLCHRSIY